jgi:hypothetical protein
MPGGLPTKLHYNPDRALLEVRADVQNCPLSARSFFELNVNSRGEVNGAGTGALWKFVNLQAATTETATQPLQPSAAMPAYREVFRTISRPHQGHQRRR